MANKFLQDVEGVGKKIEDIVEWPIKHAEALGEFLVDAKKDYPATEGAIVQTVALIEKLGPDALTAIAEKGLNFQADATVEADVQTLFSYIKGTLLPAIEADYADFKKVKATIEPAAAAPLDPAAAGGSQVHTQTPE